MEHVKSLFAALAFFYVTVGHAAVQVLECAYMNDPKHVPVYTPVAESQAAFAQWATTPSGMPFHCSMLSTVEATNYVKITADGGKTYSWVTLASQNLGTPATVTPVTPTPPTGEPQAVISWKAPTTFVSGAPITGAITYTVYRGATATSLAKLTAGLTATTYTDPAPSSTATNYFYGVTATVGGLESAMSATASVLLQSVVPATPSKVQSVTVK